MSYVDTDQLASACSTRSEAGRSLAPRVVVLFEPGRSGSAALQLARRLVEDDGSALTVLAVAPQGERLCCGAGSPVDYNRAVCEAVSAELRDARALLGPAGDRALFKLLVQNKDPSLMAWIAARAFDVVLLPARGRLLRRGSHPAADRLRRSTTAEVRIVGPHRPR